MYKAGGLNTSLVLLVPVGWRYLSPSWPSYMTDELLGITCFAFFELVRLVDPAIFRREHLAVSRRLGDGLEAETRKTPLQRAEGGEGVPSGGLSWWWPCRKRLEGARDAK